MAGLMNDYGLLTGLAEGLKGGVSGYLDQQKRNKELEALREDREFKKKQYAADLLSKGLKENDTGGVEFDAESPIQRSREMDLQQKRNQGLLGAAKEGFTMDESGGLIQDPMSQAYRKNEADIAKTLADAAKTGRERPESPKAAASAKITEGQRKAAGFAARLEQAEKDLNQSLSQYDPTRTGEGLLSKYAPNIVRSQGMKSYEQAKKNFINAVLRNESGASISPQEFANAEAQYFPVEGDTAEVKAQKARNRQIKLAEYRATAGKGAMSEMAEEQGLLKGSDQGETKVIGNATYRKVQGGWQKVK